MAHGRTSKRISESGHDFLYDYPCSLCERYGREDGATKFCKECFVYMCDICVKTKHDAFPLNKRHKMLDQTQFSLVKESFPTQPCTKHPGELVNIYCGDHDVVCCIVCKKLEHSNCLKSQLLADTYQPSMTSRHFKKSLKKTTDHVQPLHFEEYGIESRKKVIYKMCAIGGGTTLIMKGNNKLEAFDSTNECIGSLDVKGTYVSVCSVSGSRAALLYNEEIKVESHSKKKPDNPNPSLKIGFISVGKQLIMYKLFSIENPATGMVYEDGLIYVYESVDESANESDNESYEPFPVVRDKSIHRGKGFRVAVYNESGQLLRSIPHAPSLLIYEPCYMAVNGDDYLLFAYFSTGTISVLDKYENMVHYNVGDQKNLKICSDGGDQVFFCTSENEVVRLSVRSKMSKVILSEEDGIIDPHAICFDRNSSRLLVLCREMLSKRMSFLEYKYTVLTFS